MVGDYLVAVENVVGILVPDGDAVPAVALDNIVLEEAMDWPTPMSNYDCIFVSEAGLLLKRIVLELCLDQSVASI